MRDYLLYIQDINKSLVAILEFTQDSTLESFIKDDKTSSAVVRKFEIIGEASKNIPESIKVKYPTIPWKKLAGFRDVLIHNYFGIEFYLVWNFIQENVTELNFEIENVIKQEIHPNNN
jgi:uncharacterized protein with HEPN domain